MLYNDVMAVMVSEFRRNLFALLERVTNGELVEFTHRGRTYSIVEKQPAPKMSRLVENDFLIGSLEEVEAAQEELNKRNQEAWEQQNRDRLS